jgi:hypothetical protein
VQWNGVFFVYLIAFPIWAAMLVWLFEPQKHEDAADAPATPTTPFPWSRALAVVAVTFSASLLYYVFIIMVRWYLPRSAWTSRSAMPS